MTNLLHGIHHKFVYVPVVLHGILIVKVTAKSEHDVFRSIVAGLKENISDEGIHTFVHIVAHQVRVILKMDYQVICNLTITSYFICTLKDHHSYYPAHMCKG